MKEKLMALFQDEAFVKALDTAKTDQEVLDLLKKNGIEANSMDEVRAQMTSAKQEISDDDLDAVAGGRIISTETASRVKDVLSKDVLKLVGARFGLDTDTLMGIVSMFKN